MTTCDAGQRHGVGNDAGLGAHLQFFGAEFFFHPAVNFFILRNPFFGNAQGKTAENAAENVFGPADAPVGVVFQFGKRHAGLSDPPLQFGAGNFDDGIDVGVEGGGQGVDFAHAGKRCRGFFIFLAASSRQFVQGRAAFFNPSVFINASE